MWFITISVLSVVIYFLFFLTKRKKALVILDKDDIFRVIIKLSFFNREDSNLMLNINKLIKYNKFDYIIINNFKDIQVLTIKKKLEISLNNRVIENYALTNDRLIINDNITTIKNDILPLNDILSKLSITDIIVAGKTSSEVFKNTCLKMLYYDYRLYFAENMVSGVSEDVLTNIMIKGANVYNNVDSLSIAFG